MASNLSKLNDSLFDQLDRLNNPSLNGDALEEELKRAHAVTSVSKEIVSSSRLVLDAEKHRTEMGSLYKMPQMLENKE
jgi:hypothetical protein